MRHSDAVGFEQRLYKQRVANAYDPVLDAIVQEILDEQSATLAD